MANVFTKASKKPRSTTLADFCGVDRTLPRIFPRPHSPTRVANPHPLGLVYQVISQNKKSYGIWHPNFNRIATRMPKMLHHTRWVNFSNGPSMSPYTGKEEAPEIKYTETTTSRVSYCNPSCFPDLRCTEKPSRYAHTPNRYPVTGIIPSLKPKQYVPVNDN